MKAFRPFALAATCLVLSLHTHAAPLLLEDFDDNASNHVVVVDGEATPAAVNIRRGTNNINTNTDNGFDSFFTVSRDNRFLVLGDDEGGIAGHPNGQPSGGALSEARFSLGTFSTGRLRLHIQFDFVVDTNSNVGSSRDDFDVLLLDSNGNTLRNLLRLNRIEQDSFADRGHFDTERNLNLTTDSEVFLAFRLMERDGQNSSAAGIDNLRVDLVSEPASWAMAGLAVLALLGQRRSFTRSPLAR